jgi:transcriptional regulator with XRE-family HTH domain
MQGVSVLVKKRGPKSLADLIEERRAELGWSKKVAAQRCGFQENEYQTFVAYSNGGIKTPPPEKLAALSRGLGIDIRVLMEATDYAPLLEGFTPDE